MVADFGTFRRGDAVRRAATPAQAVTLKSQGWVKDDAPAAKPVIPAPAADLTLEDHDEEVDS